MALIIQKHLAQASNIHVIISIAISNKWQIHQLDINNSFLYGDLAEDAFMQQPPDFTSTNITLVCKLRKAIYGLKQA